MAAAAWILLGLVIGALSRLILPGRQPDSCRLTLLLATAGALLGGYTGRLLGLYGSWTHFSSLLLSTLAAVAALAIRHVIASWRPGPG